MYGRLWPDSDDRSRSAIEAAPDFSTLAKPDDEDGVAGVLVAA